eukprot:Hpha_TRINITY_DN15411_c5_g7::TRINITY_DN15411_c5_g7_i1::g.177156::m.177156/K03327/TC.MATE, SLC47A, norM, mdtK, dinF; multidrug resistance protein, MATE family
MAHQACNRFFVVSMQLWAISLPTLFLSGLDSDTVAAGGVLANLSLFIFSIFWGWGAAVQVIGAQHVGAGDAVRFRACVHVATAATALGIVIVCLVCYLVRNELIKIFSSDPEVQRAAADAMPYLCLYTLVMGVGQVFDGCLDACCLNSWRTYGTFFTVLVVGIPSAVGLALGTSLKLKGLWLGLLVGAAARLVTFTVMYSRIDLDTVIHNARERQELMRKHPVDSTSSVAQDAEGEGGLLLPEPDTVALLDVGLGSGLGVLGGSDRGSWPMPASFERASSLAGSTHRVEP